MTYFLIHSIPRLMHSEISYWKCNLVAYIIHRQMRATFPPVDAYAGWWQFNNDVIARRGEEWFWDLPPSLLTMTDVWIIFARHEAEGEEARNFLLSPLPPPPAEQGIHLCQCFLTPPLWSCAIEWSHVLIKPQGNTPDIDHDNKAIYHLTVF